MRLTKVRVTKLFGLFDHEIPLNREERITIIHGPNGFGKTIVLRMIAALFSRDYFLFQQVPLETFAVEFDDGRCLTVRPREGSSFISSNLDFSLFSPSFPEPDTERIDLFGNPVGAGVGLKPRWLPKLLEESPMVRIVRTQRLDVEGKEDGGEEGVGVMVGETSSRRSAVEVFSKELSGLIRQTLAAYATRSQELDRTFPVRLMGQGNAEPLAAEELRRRMTELEQKRAMLTRLGFLEPEQGLEQAPVQAIETKRDVLTIYVGDVESKLAIFDAIASKFQLFTQIINERFLYKRLEIHREQGFVFTSASGARLAPSDLSSGEQHELILFYELLFKLEKNALVLIDEPEISLHVAWQEKFLGDLMEVVKLSEIDVVVATHSPEIIGEHWDLTVELKGPSEIRKD